MIGKILIRAPEALKTALQARADARGQTMNGFILQILWDWLKTNAESTA